VLKKYQAMGKPMPIAVGIGGDPLYFLLGAARLPAFESGMTSAVPSGRNLMM
jgi:4-hydroxy-3-polyprenylbenzoate decarboxylase